MGQTLFRGKSSRLPSQSLGARILSKASRTSSDFCAVRRALQPERALSTSSAQSGWRRSMECRFGSPWIPRHAEPCIARSKRCGCFSEGPARGALKLDRPRYLRAHGRAWKAHALRDCEHALVDAVAVEAGTTELHRGDATVGLNQPTDRDRAWTSTRLEICERLAREKLCLMSAHGGCHSRRTEVCELGLGLGTHEQRRGAGRVRARCRRDTLFRRVVSGGLGSDVIAFDR